MDAARALAWGGPDDPGDWQPVTRTFRDGHAETWWAADATLGGWGPDGTRRLVVATADPGTLPDKATWYLVTNLPRPGGPREAGSPHPAADLAEIVRIYGDPELDRAELQAGQRRAGLGRLPGPLRCRDPPPPGPGQLRVQLLLGRLVRRSPARTMLRTAAGPGRGERGAVRRRTAGGTVVAAGAARGTRLAFPLDRAAALVARMVQSAPAPAAAGPDQSVAAGRGLHLYIPN